MRVRPMVKDDIPEVAAITSSAFNDEDLHRYLWPHQDKYPDDLRRWQLIRLRTRFVNVGQHGFVVVTEEKDPDWKGKSEVVGFAFWVRHGEDEGAKKWKTDSLMNKLERQLLGWEMWYETTLFDRAADPVRDKAYMKLAPWTYFVPIGPSWHLGIIGVSPKHQRRGIGSMLVEHGQKIAAEEGVPLTLESSVKGRGMYLKNGFKIVREVVISEELPTDMLMVWEPKSMQGEWLEDIVGDRAILTCAKTANPTKGA